MVTLYGLFHISIITTRYYGQIYSKNNKERIYDADLILPGQSLIIYQLISDESKSKARYHAKTRGLWVVGYREESDISFLE